MKNSRKLLISSIAGSVLCQHFLTLYYFFTQNYTSKSFDPKLAAFLLLAFVLILQLIATKIAVEGIIKSIEASGKWLKSRFFIFLIATLILLTPVSDFLKLAFDLDRKISCNFLSSHPLIKMTCGWAAKDVERILFNLLIFAAILLLLKLLQTKKGA